MFVHQQHQGVAVFTLDSEYDQAMERLLRLEGSQEISVVNEFLEVIHFGPLDVFLQMSSLNVTIR